MSILKVMFAVALGTYIAYEFTAGKKIGLAKKKQLLAESLDRNPEE